MKNYYKILEVDEDASQEVIKGVYKLHIKKNHPDLFQGEEKIRAEERLKKLNEAYEVLSDENKRKEHDKALKEEYEKKLRQLKEENEKLKNALLSEEQHLSDFNDEKLFEYESGESNFTEYQPDERLTYENNNIYITKLLQKELLVKIVVTICIVIAASVGIYRATGINLFEIFFKALFSAFG